MSTKLSTKLPILLNSSSPTLAFLEKANYISQMNQKAVGQMIRKRRRMLNVRQAELAEIARITRRTLSKIERGEANPTLDTLDKILDVLGLEIFVRVKVRDHAEGNRL